MKRQILASLSVGAALLATPALAQSNELYAPYADASMTYPGFFSGAYVGAEIGLINNNQNTFFTNANTYRIPAGVFGGYNYQATPWLVAGVEGQADLTWDWASSTTGYNLMALARMGVLAADNLMFSFGLGAGIIDGRSAWTTSLAIEHQVTDTFSARANFQSYGQLGVPTGVTNYGGITAMKITVGGLWHFSGNDKNSTALADAGWSQTTDFIGPYLGIYSGMVTNPNFNFFVPTALNGWHQSRFIQGGLGGWNFALSDNFRAGVEIQAGMTNDTSGDLGVEAQVLGRVGAVPFEGTFIYATGGLGVLENRAGYAIGAGIEHAFWGRATLRTEIQALGELAPVAAGNNGITAYKGTIGALWHLDD